MCAYLQFIAIDASRCHRRVCSTNAFIHSNFLFRTFYDLLSLSVSLLLTLSPVPALYLMHMHPKLVHRILYEVNGIYLVSFCEWWHWLDDTMAKRSDLLFHRLLLVAKWDSREIQSKNCQQPVSVHTPPCERWAFKCQYKRTYQFLPLHFMYRTFNRMKCVCAEWGRAYLTMAKVLKSRFMIEHYGKQRRMECINCVPCAPHPPSVTPNTHTHTHALEDWCTVLGS